MILVSLNDLHKVICGIKKTPVYTGVATKLTAYEKIDCYMRETNLSPCLKNSG
jgi:hypothetical protein